MRSREIRGSGPADDVAVPRSPVHAGVGEFYDRLWRSDSGQSWDRWPFFLQSGSAVSQGQKLLGEVRGKRILELASGEGTRSVELALRGGEVCAVDISVEGLSRTRSLAANHGVGDRLMTVRASMEHLPFADNGFDLVMAQNCLMHVAPAPVGAEVFRVLKPGGRAVVVEPIAHHPLVRLYRVFSGYNGLRTRWLNHAGLKRFVASFPAAEVRYFHLTSALAALPALQKRCQVLPPLLACLNGIDRVLCRTAPFLAKFAWIAVVEARKPGETRGGLRGRS